MSRTLTTFAILCLLATTSYGQNYSSLDQAENTQDVKDGVKVIKIDGLASSSAGYPLK